SGNDYDHARHCSPVQGRFLSPDKVGGRPLEPQSWNRYSYARNNPLSLVDPNGEDPTIFQNAAAAVISAGSAIQQAGTSLNHGGPVGVAVDFLLGTVGSVVQGTGDLLNVGTATGEAIGSGVDSFDLAKAISTDVGRASGIVLTLAGAAEGLGAGTTRVVHFTNDANLAHIEASGQLRGGANATFITKPSEVRGMTASQVETKLGINLGKGQNSITLRMKNSNLRVPDNGPTTQGGAWQRQLKNPCSIENACVGRVPN
ncbi:MAG: RHS repeat-associated core domain-containing protein, partial [Thermoanaerobaculia bacterium]